MPARSTLPRSFLSAALLLFGPFGCERPPSENQAKEWSPADHDHAADTENVAGGTQAPADLQKDDGRALTEVAWQQNCGSCHGPFGRGDGPNGPMVHASDLTRPDWQARVTDADIAATIRQGKGKMPKFDLPDSVIEGLVGRIRAFRRP